ncbi:hypothetical protein GWK47_051572 [Chionoecetes opilio]|uniref:Uncharacterized protein n=1 Tax=Chionoecetes opilio TaxID=41210 RepID=A0A8J4Y1Z0_CHIOP|nr:hypothetical protein GWK47_051572 [Chionoecetes opilio]
MERGGRGCGPAFLTPNEEAILPEVKGREEAEAGRQKKAAAEKKHWKEEGSQRKKFWPSPGEDTTDEEEFMMSDFSWTTPPSTRVRGREGTWTAASYPFAAKLTVGDFVLVQLVEGERGGTFVASCSGLAIMEASVDPNSARVSPVTSKGITKRQADPGKVFPPLLPSDDF